LPTFVSNLWSGAIPRDLTEFFQDGLGQADHTLAQAIENLDLGISTEPKSAPASTLPAPLVVNSNTNVISVNLVSVVEALAAEIEKQDPVEGERFRETLKRWAQNPKVWDLLIKGGDLILRSVGRAEFGF
jgi:hypothetical protein